MTEMPSKGSFPGPQNVALYFLSVALAGIMGVAGKRSALGTTRLTSGLLTLAMLAALLMTASCAGVIQKSAAQPASYVVTVTASAANAPTHTEQFTLTVLP